MADVKYPWEKLDLGKYEEGEIVCYSCGNSNSAIINSAFAFYQFNGKYSGNEEYENETVLCQTCMKADNLLCHRQGRLREGRDK